MKNRKIVVANWKMNPESPEVARATFLGIRRAVLKLKKTDVVVCPPTLYFAPLAKLAAKKVFVGLQNVFWENTGSFTGETGASMAVTSGAQYVIIGHSERRALGETPELINKKLLAAFREGLNVILCVGEKEHDAQGQYLSFVKEQLASALAGIQKKYVENLIIAYEPIWAIGKNDYEAMKGNDMHEMLLYIRKVLTEMLGREYADTIPVLYGGSVNAMNTSDIVGNGHVDGLLVGRQSLDPAQFKDILTIVDSFAVQNKHA